MRISKFLQRYCIDSPEHFRLRDHNPGDTAGLEKKQAKELLAQGVKRLADLQERL